MSPTSPTALPPPPEARPGAVASGSARIETARGAWTITWGVGGLSSLHAEAPGAPLRPDAPAWVTRLARDLGEHLRGERLHDFREVPLDWTGRSAFQREALEALRRLAPAGRTMTYQELALALGRPGAARAVGRALATNPFLLVVPCHRVLRGDGGLGGFSAPGGVALKRRLLALEAQAGASNRQGS